MKSLKTAATVAIVAAAMSLTACASNEQDAQGSSTAASSGSAATSLSGEINVGGSSAQTAAQEAWRAGFQEANPGVTVNYDPVGSGAGRENFQEGGFVVAGTDAAFSADAAKAGFSACAAGSDLVEIPAYISPIVVAFKLEGIDALKMDAGLISDIFTGKVTSWDDPAIAAQNPDLELPSSPITAVHRSDKSGTTENFTDYLSQVAPEAWPYEAAEEWPTGLAGEAAEKTQGVVATLGSTNGAIGYIDASQSKGLGVVMIKVGDSYVPFSAEAAAQAVDASPLESGRAATDIAVSLDRTVTAEGAYPMLMVSYLAACGSYADGNDGTLVKAYLSYVISEEGQQAAAENAGSAPLTGELLDKAISAVDAIK